MLDCSALEGAVAVDGVDAAADDGAASSSTGQSPLSGGAVLAGSGDGAGEAVFGGEGAGEATFGFSVIHPPEVSAKRDRDPARTKHVCTHPASGSHDRGQIRASVSARFRQRRRASVPDEELDNLARKLGVSVTPFSLAAITAQPAPGIERGDSWLRLPDPIRAVGPTSNER
jgi:hypothetical protein